MELNKRIVFTNKTDLVQKLDKFHDSTCNFKVIDDKKIKVLLHTIESIDTYIIIALKNKVTSSFMVYDYTIDSSIINGKIVSNDEVSDLECLNVELIDFLFTNSGLIIHACDRTSNGLGNDKIIQLWDVDYIEIN